MRDHGFSSMLDGDGGDELFGMSRRIGDLTSLRNWSRLGAVIASTRRRRALIWRGLIVPHLPGLGRAAWNWREHRRLAGTPPWMSRRFWNDDATRQAREQADSWRLIDSSSVALAKILEHPGNAGSRSAQRLMAASLGLELRSPLLDRAIVEFVLGLPPELLWVSAESKSFLRAAGKGRLPSDVLNLEKHVDLHRFMRDRALSQEDPNAVARLVATNDLLVDLVETDVVCDSLRKVRQGALSDRDCEALYALIATARWMQAAAAEYRV
jgi:asparagine synthetase B (glutamine-hydrolysing)